MSAVQSLISIVESLLGDDDGAKTALQAVKDEQAAEETELAALKAQIEALPAPTPAFDPSALQTSLDALSTKVDGLAAPADIDPLTERVAALEARNALDDAPAAGLPAPPPVTGTVTISIGPVDLPDPVVGTPYTANLSATGSAALPYQFSVAAGALPDGLALAGGGSISGTPTTVGESTFSIQAHDANNLAGVQEFTLTVDAAGPIEEPVVEPEPTPEPSAT